LLRSITIDSTPNVTEYFRFAFITVLQAVKTVLTCYPINVLIFFALTLYLVNKIASFFQGKKKFSETYEPRQHQENSLEEVKMLKKEIRAVQTDLIELLKKSKPAEGQ
jgi:DNA integrity scanning protein DisA with diadenylate cyclase activity